MKKRLPFFLLGSLLIAWVLAPAVFAATTIELVPSFASPPNLKSFTSTMASVKQELIFTWIAEWISAIYYYAIGIGIIATILSIMIGGFQYILSPVIEGIKSGKKRIIDSIVGLVVLLSAYAIFDTIAPITTNLIVTAYPSVVLAGADEGDINNNPTALVGTTCPLPAAGCKDEVTCTDLCKPGNESKRPKCSPATASPSQVAVIDNKTGIKNVGSAQFLKALLSPQSTSPIYRAGTVAASGGYTLYITSGWRPLKNQWNLACEKINAGKGEAVWGQHNSVAKPGTSNHGRGGTLDVVLWKGNNNLTGTKSIGAKSDLDACKQNDPSLRTASMELTRIMTAAGFQRLRNEIWHFEYGTPVSSRVCGSVSDCPHPPNILVNATCK